MNWCEGVRSGVRVCGDVRDPHFCKEITREIDVIFHLAARMALSFL